MAWHGIHWQQRHHQFVLIRYVHFCPLWFLIPVQKKCVTKNHCKYVLFLYNRCISHQTKLYPTSRMDVTSQRIYLHVWQRFSCGFLYSRVYFPMNGQESARFSSAYHKISSDITSILKVRSSLFIIHWSADISQQHHKKLAVYLMLNPCFSAYWSGLIFTVDF